MRQLILWTRHKMMLVTNDVKIEIITTCSYTLVAKIKVIHPPGCAKGRHAIKIYLKPTGQIAIT